MEQRSQPPARVPGDQLGALLELPDVAGWLDGARDRVDAVLSTRIARTGGAGAVVGDVAGEAALHGAVASAALEGHQHDVAAVRAGTVTNPVVQGALRATGALVGLAPAWSRSPRQVLARLHMLAAKGCPAVTDDQLGRPIGEPAVMARLDTLCDLVLASRTGPALLRAAVVHAELLALRPFAGPSGVVARAAARLTLLASGFDERGLLDLDTQHLARRSEYVGAANAFATGTRDGLRSWFRHYTGCASDAAARTAELLAGRGGEPGDDAVRADGPIH